MLGPYSILDQLIESQGQTYVSIFFNFLKTLWSGRMKQAWNPAAWEAEAERPQVQGQCEQLKLCPKG